jgi:hypothetical protein
LLVGYAYWLLKEAVAKFPEDKQITVLHFADHDSSGLDMTRDLEQRLRRYSELEGLDLNISVQRIALTHQQVQEYNLTPNPTKTADPRATGYTEEFGNQSGS